MGLTSKKLYMTSTNGRSCKTVSTCQIGEKPIKLVRQHKNQIILRSKSYG